MLPLYSAVAASYRNRKCCCDHVTDGGHVTEGRLLAVMRDARRLVGVSHLNICPVAAVCFDSVSAEPVWFLYHSSSTSVFLKKFLDDARKQANVRRVQLLSSPTAASCVSRRLLRVYFEVYWPACKPEGPLFSAEFVCESCDSICLCVCLSVCF